ncbi:MAG: YicC/YloC family endoribonuclease [Hydrogenovibrio sp.]|uniref:YicC/YloC family endoribonuclease n=1 Tax=Hydrogenovibrio TaxID=28884 RepID=UPI000378C70E|nr:MULTISPECIES: YicC/YloC family endoribonuclease [Hydrogenovibrio]MDR9499851.1 YicC/YloC family endoribonuclease [Hydrogenovibrio sp.]
MKSMTAYTHRTFQDNWGEIVWTLRSVNHRYLETQYQLPPETAFAEPALRDLVKQHLARGRLSLTLQLQPANRQDSLQLDRGLLSQLSHNLEQIQHSLRDAGQVDPVALLKWPGLVKESAFGDLKPEQFKRRLQDTLKEALIEHVQTRTREGVALKNGLMQRLDQARAEVKQAQSKMPQIRQQSQQKLKQRFESTSLDVSAERLAQEAALLIQKMDIDEEIDRLNAHLTEVKRVMDSDGPVGRRLDFLMQELNREANTIASKSPATEISQISIELKVLIEQMREQIQNIE